MRELLSEFIGDFEYEIESQVGKQFWRILCFRIDVSKMAAE